MTIFEQKGIQKQYGATSVYKAKKELEHSCSICGIKGKRINCATCAIARVHNDIINFVLK